MAGEPGLAHKATAEARVAVEAILGEPAEWDPRAIPAVIFTDPEIAWALDASLDIRLRWNGEGLDRLLDEAHADWSRSLVKRLRADGWVTEVEVSFSIRGERGSIDVLGYHEATGIVLVSEVKSVVPGLAGDTLRAGSQDSAGARDRATSAAGRAAAVARLLVVGDSTTTRRRIDALDATYRAAFPVGAARPSMAARAGRAHGGPPVPPILAPRAR